MRSLELFAGAGGLAIGASNAGFQPEAIVEWDQHACDTIRQNKVRGVKPVVHWPDVSQKDVAVFDFHAFREDIDLLSGGVPCQPWSVGGKHRGHRDERNLFPEMVRAIRALAPKAVLIENVKGIQRRTFTNYFEYIKHQIRYPEITQKASESWRDHLARLERHHTGGIERGLYYTVVARLLNAADYGVPQRRERVFIVAFRSDLGIEWSFPEEANSFDALLWDQYVTGEYWDRHEVPVVRRPKLAERLVARVTQLRESLFPPPARPWKTVRDALAGLPDPEKEPREAATFFNHRFNPGARSYPGHTGSPLDEPSKTLKAGVHGVPGGENTILFPDGRFRYLSTRESARIQTFPDDFVFHGSWTETMRQIGNAVPVHLAETVARHIAAHLERRVS